MEARGVEQESARERIVREATRLFTRYGVRSVKMDDIAEGLHISKRTIYEHVRDKDELLMLCVIQILTEHRQERDRILGAASNVIEGIIGVVNHATQIVQHTNPAMIREIERYYPRVREVIRQYREDNEYRDTMELIDRGIQQGLFLPTVNADLEARLLLAQFDVIANERVFPPEKYSPVDLVRTVVINFIRGIATEQGRQLVDRLVKQDTFKSI